MSKKVSQSTVLAELAGEIKQLFNYDAVAYAVIDVEGHEETWPLRTRPLRTWLARLYHRCEGSTPSTQAINDAMNVLEGKALFESPTVPVHTRLAEHDGAIFLDLCDEYWHVVEITSTGWKIIGDPPVHFRRARGMLSLPSPVLGGSIAMLRPFLNLDHDSDAWILVVAFLVAALRPQGPYTCLALAGEQGAGKSWAGQVCRSLVDPNKAGLRAEPRDERDLVIAAKNGWVCGFDNISYLPRWLSDAVCRLCTGSGFATRMLYADDEEIIFSARRPVILNAIEEVITRGDLLDRSLVISLPPMPDENRREEDELNQELDEARPAILGGLLDAVATGLANLPTTRLARPPRMADFATWVVACEPSLPWEPGAFLAAYTKNRSSAVALTLDTSPLTAPLAIVARQTFHGSATELLAELEKLVEDDVRRKKDWPTAPHVLSGKLRRLAPSLRKVGIGVEFDRDSTKRMITIRTVPRLSVMSVASVTEGAGDDDADDADDAVSPDLSEVEHEERQMTQVR
jgi:hypothetical protein